MQQRKRARGERVLALGVLLFWFGCFGCATTPPHPGEGESWNVKGENTEVHLVVRDARPRGANRVYRWSKLRSALERTFAEQLREGGFRTRTVFVDPLSEFEISLRRLEFRSGPSWFGGKQLVAVIAVHCTSNHSTYRNQYRTVRRLSPGAVRAGVSDPERIKRREIHRALPGVARTVLGDRPLRTCLTNRP